MQFLAAEGVFDTGLKIRPMVLPDMFIDQDKPEKQYELAELTAEHIVAKAMGALGVDETKVTELPVRA